jgi:hypothetical protein
LNEQGQDYKDIVNSDEFSELIHIGHLVHTFDWQQHKFEIKTLKIEEELVVGQLIKEYKDTIAEEKAAAVAIAAACLVSVNNKPFMPEYDKTAYISIRERFNYIIQNWNTVIVDAINVEYLQLLTEVYDILERTENLSQKDLMNSNLPSDPLIEQEQSIETQQTD